MNHEDNWQQLNLRVILFKRAIRDAINNTPTTKDPNAIRLALVEIGEEIAREAFPWMFKTKEQADAETRILHERQHAKNNPLKCECGEDMDFTSIVKCVDCGKVLCGECSFFAGNAELRKPRWLTSDRSRCKEHFEVRQVNNG